MRSNADLHLQGCHALLDVPLRKYQLTGIPNWKKHRVHIGLLFQLMIEKIIMSGWLKEDSQLNVSQTHDRKGLLIGWLWHVRCIIV
jgi:hypothetical protein